MSMQNPQSSPGSPSLHERRLKRAIRQSIWTNALLGTLAILMLIAVLVMISTEPMAWAPNPSELLGEVQKEIGEHSGEIVREATPVLVETVPPMSQALYNKISEDIPVYAKALKEEGGVLTDNMIEELRIEVKQRYRAFFEEHRDVLAEEFPEHATEEEIDQMIAKFEDAIDQLIDRYHIQQLRNRVKGIVSAWDQIEPVPDPAEGEPTLQEQLLDYGTDWLVLALKDEAQGGLSGSNGIGNEDAQPDEPGTDDQESPESDNTPE